MNSKFKKIMAMTISASIAFGIVTMSGFAEDSVPSQEVLSGGVDDSVQLLSSGLTGEVGYIYNYLDKSDKVNVNTARNNIENYSNSAVSDVINAIGDELITEEVLAKYSNNTVSAKTAVAQLLLKSLRVYFAKSVDEFDTLTAETEGSIAEYTDTLFGKGKSYDWLRAYTVARKLASSNQSSKDRYTWALDKYEYVFESLDALQVTNMDTLLADYGIDISAIGWTTQNIVDACRNIMGLVDSNNVGEWALVKAAARSSTTLYINDAKFDSEYAGAVIDNNTKKLSIVPSSIDVRLEIGLDNGADDVTDIVDVDVVTVDGTGTANVNIITTGERVNGFTSRYYAYAQITFSKSGIYDVTLHRRSGTENDRADWLSRFRVIVARTINNVVWNSLSGTAVTFNPVTNAEKYVVDIYKDGKLIDTVELSKSDVLKVDFADYTKSNGSGNYYAEATAYGEFEKEEYSEPTKSQEYAYTATVGNIGKPIWEIDGTTGETKPILHWDPADNATAYIVTLYGDELDKPITYTVAEPDHSKDLTSDIAGKYGTFYATVQPLNNSNPADVIYGSVSDPSDDYTVARTYKLTGKVLLEGALKQNTARKDTNAGTKITIAETGDFTISADDGTYSFDNLPYSSSGYTLIYEKKSYLKSKKQVTLSDMNIVVPDEFLYFGDFKFSGSVQINIADLTDLLTKFGFVYGESGWDDSYSLGDDSVINDEVSVVIRNYGKKFTNN